MNSGVNSHKISDLNAVNSAFDFNYQERLKIFCYNLAKIFQRRQMHIIKAFQAVQTILALGVSLYEIYSKVKKSKQNN